MASSGGRRNSAKAPYRLAIVCISGLSVLTNVTLTSEQLRNIRWNVLKRLTGKELNVFLFIDLLPSLAGITVQIFIKFGGLIFWLSRPLLSEAFLLL